MTKRGGRQARAVETPRPSQAVLKGLQEQTGEEVAAVRSFAQHRKLGGPEDCQAGYTKRPLAAQILVKGGRGS